MKNVLVLCTDNTCRSQMAEGYLKRFAKQKAIIYSTGIETDSVCPKSIAIMKIDGIDISKQTSNHVSEYRHINFDYIITVCDNILKKSPLIFGENVECLHQHFLDPSKTKGSEEHVFNVFTEVRNQIKLFCQKFVEKEL